MSDDENTDREELAEDRTGLAEDRTVLANERTFGGWTRTAFAAVGIGVGFRALFDELDPPWVPKAVATLFILLGMFIIAMAERRAGRINQRLTAHQIKSTPLLPIRLIAVAFCLGSAVLIAGLWILY